MTKIGTNKCYQPPFYFLLSTRLVLEKPERGWRNYELREQKQKTLIFLLIEFRYGLSFSYYWAILHSHAILKITLRSFQGRRTEKTGHHFGANLGFISGKGSISGSGSFRRLYSFLPLHSRKVSSQIVKTQKIGTRHVHVVSHESWLSKEAYFFDFCYVIEYWPIR